MPVDLLLRFSRLLLATVVFPLSLAFEFVDVEVDDELLSAYLVVAVEFAACG